METNACYIQAFAEQVDTMLIKLIRVLNLLFVLSH